MSSVGVITVEIGNPAFLSWNELGSKSHSRHDAILSYYFRTHIYSVAQGLSYNCDTMPELINAVGSYLS